jgi:hypothetical protein
VNIQTHRIPDAAQRFIGALLSRDLGRVSVLYFGYVRRYGQKSNWEG